MSNAMPIFPKFNALEYLSEKPKTLAALDSLGAVILPFEKILREDEQERFEERAAILEFDGGISRMAAEEMAKRELCDD